MVLRKFCFILCLICSVASAQVWDHVFLDGNVRFKFPEDFSKVDSSDFTVYQRKTPVGLFRALKSTNDLDVANHSALAELFDAYKYDKLSLGGEVIYDEIIPYQEIYAARYVISKVYDDQIVMDYYLTFYTGGHFYVFQYTYTGTGYCKVIWSNDLHNNINISPPAVPDFIEPQHVFTAIQFIPIAIVMLTVLLTVLLVQRKRGKLF